jgi:NitT/TauT family transport system substrate-binding protein
MRGSRRGRDWPPGMSKARALALGVLVALVTAACGGDDEQPPEGQAQSPGGEAAVELSSINLGLLPLADIAPVYMALQQGLFQDEGLVVEIQIVESGATAIPALVSGDLDITFGNYVSFFLANNEGLDLRIIAEQNRAVPDYSSVMTLPDSGIEGPEDLEGRTLAVNALSNVAEITARAQIKDAGGDPDAVEYVEVAFPDMIAALDRGDVDAIFAVEPFVGIAEQDLGAVEVVNPYGGRLDGFPVAGFYTTAGFAEANPNTIAAFQRAMVEASRLAADDPEQVVQILPTYTELTPELAANLTQPEYVSEIDVSRLEVVSDLMVEFGLLEEAPDLNSLVILTP